MACLSTVALSILFVGACYVLSRHQTHGEGNAVSK